MRTGAALVVPIEEDNHSGDRLGRAVYPLTSVLEPLHSVYAACEFRNHAGFNIAALVGAPAHEAGTPLHTAAEAVPRPVRLAAYIAHLRQGNGHDLIVAVMDAIEDSRPKGVVLVLQQLRKILSLFFIEAVFVSHFLQRLVGHGDIQRGSRLGGFGLHDVAVTVIGFGDDCFRMAFRAGGYIVHLPKYILEKLLFGVVHRGNLHRLVGIGVDLDRVNRKDFLPHGAASRHFQCVIGSAVSYLQQPVVVIRVDLLHGCLHRHSRSGILAGKEYPENRAANQSNQANHDNDRNSDPAACGDSSDQCFCRRYDCFDCGNRCFYGSFYTGNCCLGCCFGGLCSFLRCFHRSLCGFLRRLCRLLCGLDCRFRGLDRPLCGFGCTFPGSLDGFLTGRTGRLFDRLFRLLDSLDGLIPGGADSLPFH